MALGVKAQRKPGAMIEAARPMRSRWNWVFGYQAVVYAAGLLAVTGLIPAWKEWYSIQQTHGQQTEALFKGSLALSRNLADLRFSHSWSGGGVQQVWGLGVALWQLPCEVAVRMFGFREFPDRIAFGLFAGFVAFVALRGWVLAWAVESSGSASTTERKTSVWALAVGFLGGIGILLLFSPLVALLQTRRLPLEETVAYSYFFGLLLMGVLLGFLRTPTIGRWRLLCALGGMGGLLRPTLVFYGLASVAVGGWVWLKADHPGRKHRLPGLPACGRLKSKAGNLGAGLILFCAGNGVLWWTNLIRFGDGFEFGHRLNVQTTTGTMYATRFDHPFKGEPLGAAARELFGILFRVDELSEVDWYRQNSFPGQSPAVRWREFYFRTYDLTYVPLVLLGWGAAVACGLSGRGGAFRDQILGLGAWSILATAALGLFYLYVPVISSRYMMDFAPAFAVAVALGWTVLALRARRWWSCGLMSLLLCGWGGFELASARGVSSARGSITWTELNASRAQRKNAVRNRPGAGQALGEPRSGIPFDGTGWDEKTGALAPLVVLFVESPEFLELELETRPHPRIAARPEDLRAKVGLEFLERAQAMETEKGWRVRFHGPRKPQYCEGIQTAFVATVPREYLAEQSTSWVLRRARWRDADSARGSAPGAEGRAAKPEGNDVNR